MPGYANPAALITTDMLSDRLGDSTLRIVEVDLDDDPNGIAIVPGAVLWRVWGDILDVDERLQDDPAAIAALLGGSGIDRQSTVVLYGDAFNWGATLAYWLLYAIGHPRVHLLDGGRDKWLAERRPCQTTPPQVTPCDYPVIQPDWSHRARREDVLAAIDTRNTALLDVRLRGEYEGELFRPSGPPAAGQRAGHIPGAHFVPWEIAINEDGAFKSIEELRAAYTAAGVTPDQALIPYCTVGGRSSHTWFALSQLLGYPDVRLYDASWAEWGNRADTPIAQGTLSNA